MITAQIRLLANTCAPAYHVVVGDVDSAERVEYILRKLGAVILTKAHPGGPEGAVSLRRSTIG